MALRPIYGSGENYGDILGYEEIPEEVTSIPTKITVPEQPVFTGMSDNYQGSEDIVKNMTINGVPVKGFYDGSGNLTGYAADVNDTRIWYSPEGEVREAQSLKGNFLKDIATELGPMAITALTMGGGGTFLGSVLAPTASTAVQTAIGNALIQGVGAEAAGGDFLKGALTSAAGSALGAATAPVTSAVSEAVGSEALGRALTSGALAEATGGDFTQAALTGALIGAVNEAKIAAAKEYLQSLPGGYDYENVPQPTEADVIQAFPELAPSPENLTQGVTDILNYAANAPAVQVAAAPNYVGELSGVQYDPNYVSDSETGAYRLEIGGTGDQQGTEPSLTNVPTQEQAQLQIDDLIAQLEPYLAQTPTLEDIQAIIGQQNFATPEDVQTAINSIDIPQGLSESDVQNIVSNALVNNPGLTAGDVQTIVDLAVSQIPSGLTAQDVTNILGQQNFATPDDIYTAISGIQFPENMTPEDVQNIVSEAFQNNPGITATDVQDIVQGALNNLPEGLSADDVRNIVTEAVSSIPSAPTEQDIINIISGQNFATPEDIQTAINSIDIPQGLTEQDVQSIVSDAFANNPGLTSSQVSQIVNDAISQIPSGITPDSVQSIVDTAISRLPAAPTQQDIIDIIGGQGLATGQDLSNLANQLGLTQQELLNQIGQVEQGFGQQVTNLESQLTQQGRDLMSAFESQGMDYRTALDEAISAQETNFGTALGQTTEDLINQISGVQTGLESQLTSQGKDLMDALQQQGLDYNTALNEAIAAQGTEFGTALNQTTEDILSQLASQGTGLQTEFQSGLSNLAEQLGTTTEDLQNRLANAQESWSGQLSSGLSGLESQLTTQGKDFMDYLQQQGLDYETALNEAIATQGSEFGTALNQTTQDLINQISGVQTGLESQLTQQGKDLMDYFQQQGLDYETALNEAISAQGSEFGTALNQTTEDILAQLAEQGTGLQTEFKTGLQDLADQLGISQQELQDQLNQYQEDWGTQLSGVQTGLQSQLTGIESSLAESTLANKLAMLDAMKAIGGLGLSLTGINGVMQSIKDQVTPKTYEFTPVDTSGWKSPVAAQPVSWKAPTPINFGSQELLKGTQWQSPVSISQVINTLNSTQPAPFVMPSFMSTFQGAPTVGATDIIGELGGKPVSIADIVAGIQSGQNYSGTVG